MSTQDAPLTYCLHGFSPWSFCSFMAPDPCHLRMGTCRDSLRLLIEATRNLQMWSHLNLPFGCHRPSHNAAPQSACSQLPLRRGWPSHHLVLIPSSAMLWFGLGVHCSYNEFLAVPNHLGNEILKTCLWISRGYDCLRCLSVMARVPGFLRIFLLSPASCECTPWRATGDGTSTWVFVARRGEILDWVMGSWFLPGSASAVANIWWREPVDGSFLSFCHSNRNKLFKK